MVKRLKRSEGSGGPIGLVPEPIDMDEAEAALARVKGRISEEDYAFLRAVVDATPRARAALATMQISMARLRGLLGLSERR